MRLPTSLVIRLAVLPLFACGGDDDGGEGEEGEGEEGEGEEGEGEEGEGEEGEGEEGEGEEGEGEPNTLREGPICTSGGWCWETPTPGGGSISDIWAPARGELVAVSGTHLFHVEGSTIRHAAPPTLTPYLNQVPLWGSAADDVWSAGFTSLIHFDGTRWSLGGNGAVLYSSALSGVASDDVWSVGFGSVHHYDGGDWSVVETAIETGGWTDVWAFGEREAVVVGTDGAQGIALHLRNGIIDDLALPAAVTYPMAVYASAADDVWIAQGAGLQHLADGQWQESSFDVYGTRDIWGSGPDDVWFAGGTSVGHWDGESIETMPVEGAAYLTAIAGTAEDDVWVSDSIGALFHWNGEAWSDLKRPLITGTLSDVTAAADGQAWAIDPGSVLHRTADGEWSAEPSPTVSPLRGVAATESGTFLFAQGGAYRRDGDDWQLVIGGAGLQDACTTSDGTTWGVGEGFARYEGGEWVAEPELAGIAPDRLLCSGDEAWATALVDGIWSDTSTLLRYDGGQWRHIGLSSLGGMSVRAAFAPTDDAGWIVAVDEDEGSDARSVVMRFDGAEWREEPVDGQVLGAGGSAAADVWLVGEDGLVRRWTGEAFEVLDAPDGPDFGWVRAPGDGTARAVAFTGAVWDYDPDLEPAWQQVVDPLDGIDVSSDRLLDAAFAGDEIYGAGDSDEALGVVDGAWARLPGWFSATKVAANEAAGAWFVDFIGRVGHYDGLEVVQPDGSLFSAADVILPGEGTSVFVTDRGRLLELEGDTFVVEHDTEADALVAFGASSGSLWVLGQVTFPDDRTELWRKDGGQWELVPEMIGPIGLAPGPDGRLLAVDANLALWRQENGAWRSIAPAREGWQQYGVAAHVLDIDDVWVLALGGLLHWDGAAWSNLAEPVGLGFSALTVAPDGSTYAVGTGGSVVRRAP